MKYIGYCLFLFIFVAVLFIGSAKEFYLDSLDLAPEITILVSVFYVYNVLLTLFVSVIPNKIPGRANFYNVHIKMSCSVMVSLGLVGTFLGLVDMISGIGAALSGEETDFAKRMATLLAAISTSLGAMAFAFMTSILGVGLSAYSIVAATFVGSDLVARKKKEEKNEKDLQEWDVLQRERERQEKEKAKAKEEAQARAAEMIPIVTNIMETTFTPIAFALKEMESRQIQLLEYLVSDNPYKKRLETVEKKMANLDLSGIEKQLTPLALVNALSEQQSVFATYNEQISQGLKDLSAFHFNLADQVTRATNVMEGQTQQAAEQTGAMQTLEAKIKENSDALTELDSSLISANDKVKMISEKLKRVLD